MQSQSMLLFSGLCALVFALITLSVLIAKLRSRAFIRQIRALSLETEATTQVEILRGGSK